MQLKLLRLYSLLAQAAFCFFVFAVGIVSHISFFNTFIGPAISPLISVICLATIVYGMDRLKKGDEAYSPAADQLSFLPPGRTRAG